MRRTLLSLLAAGFTACLVTTTSDNNALESVLGEVTREKLKLSSDFCMGDLKYFNPLKTRIIFGYDSNGDGDVNILCLYKVRGLDSFGRYILDTPSEIAIDFNGNNEVEDDEKFSLKKETEGYPRPDIPIKHYSKKGIDI